MTITKHALVILGPTATGKTNLAIKLAKQLDAEIISLDSALVYKYMDIGTAKPSLAEQDGVVHHLIDICLPTQRYSAADFRQDCIRLVDDITSRNKRVIICGGTMLYYKALVDGIDNIPKSTDEARAYVKDKLDKYGIQALHQSLEQVDPISYQKLNPNDKQRVCRALEVYYMTNKAISSFYNSNAQKCPFALDEYVLMPQENREYLRELIKLRFLKMLDLGLIDEVESLVRRFDLNLDYPSLRAVGYKQVYEYLQQECSYEQMIDNALIATAHLAKHQMTWLRGALKQRGKALNVGDEHNCQLILDSYHNFLTNNEKDESF